MTKAAVIPAWQRAQTAMAATMIGVVVVGALYWAQVVFIPLALALFLAFLVSPFVRILQRRGLGRIPSVVAVVLLAALLLGGLGSLVAWQVTGLLAKLPDYTTNIQGKIRSLRELGSGSQRLEKMIDDVEEAWKPKPPAREGEPADKAAGVPAPPPKPQSLPWIDYLPGYVGSSVTAVASLALALVLVVFMLVKREDLRNRFIRLVGHRRMTGTTRALDDAGERISRYLLMQLVVNSAFGLAWGLGLFLVGVDYALLWGLLAAVLRYIPYLGSWVAGLVPITLSLAMFPGWVQPLFLIGLFLVLELVTSNFMEPWLYGHSMGVSGVAQLVSAALCAFLWGPVGLVLSAPLTVVLLVLGKHIPQLEFFDVILGDQPALAPDVTCYQRLLARDQDEATQLVLARAGTCPPDQVYDDLLVPALNYLKQDRERDNVSEADEQYVLRATREIAEDLGERQAAAAAKAVATAPGEAGVAPAYRPVKLLLCPGQSEGDRLVLEMFQQMLDPAHWEIEVLALNLLASELVAQVGEKDPAVVCIGALPPGGLAHTRYLCKRLRAGLPGVRIVVGRWGLKNDVDENQQRLREAGADQVETALLETRTHLSAWMPVLAPPDVKTSADDPATNGKRVAV